MINSFNFFKIQIIVFYMLFDENMVKQKFLELKVDTSGQKLVDISNKNFEEHMSTVNQTLDELGVVDKPIMLIFNKVDQYSFIEKDIDDLTPPTKDNLSIDYLRQTWISKLNKNVFFISALNKNDIIELRNFLYSYIKSIHVKRWPYDNLLY